MNKGKAQIMELEQDFKDTLQNDLSKKQTKNKIIEIKDIKLVGQINWKDKINGKNLSDYVFQVEQEIIEVDEEGKKRISNQTTYYLGDKCIGGKIGNNQIIFKQSFQESEPDKVKKINELLERKTEEEIEKTSLNHLEKEELAEILTAHLGRKVTEDEAEKIVEKLDEEEIEEVKEEKEQKKDKNENDLSENQSENVKVNGIQKADLNRLVDGKETLGKRLDLEEYDSLYVIYSDKVEEIAGDNTRNNTTYSLVGMRKDGNARVLNDEFEMDNTAGNNGLREQTKIRADSTATKDNNDLSVYTRKSNRASIGCENNQGYVNMFFYQKTIEENENIGIQVETSQTPIIPIETREIMNRNRGIYQKDKVQDEIEKHVEAGCKPDDERDFNGYEDSTHEHEISSIIDDYVMQIYNYENNEGEEKIKEVFTEDEIREKLNRELKENEDKLSIEKIVENVKQEMNQDAEILSKEHNIQ